MSDQAPRKAQPAKDAGTTTDLRPLGQQAMYFGQMLFQANAGWEIYCELQKKKAFEVIQIVTQTGFAGLFQRKWNEETAKLIETVLGSVAYAKMQEQFQAQAANGGQNTQQNAFGGMFGGGFPGMGMGGFGGFPGMMGGFGFQQPAEGAEGQQNAGFPGMFGMNPMMGGFPGMGMGGFGGFPGMMGGFGFGFQQPGAQS